MRSMTGYAHVSKANAKFQIQVMLRSGNYKYLEVSVRNHPRENIFLEERIKKEIRKQRSRGKIEIQIVFKKHIDGHIYIDESAIKKYVSEMRVLAKKYAISEQVTIGDIMSLPHVTSWEEKVGGEEDFIIPAVKEGIAQLIEFKKKEGKVIKREMLANLKKLSANAAAILKNKPKAGAGADTAKEDIDEEVSLLIFYVKKLEDKIQADHDLKGKAIDFLTQEILRELNTASAKTKNAALSALIVENKNYLERIREQAQNIE